MSFLFHLPIFVLLCLISFFDWFMTFLGSSIVLFMKKQSTKLIHIALGSSAGIMIAASFFSLLLPAMDYLSGQSKLSLLVIPMGFMSGVLFLRICDHFLPHEHMLSSDKEGIHSSLSNIQLLILAMTLHNIPEGLAVGVAFASGKSTGIITALVLGIGIGIQNFPEGAAISLPLHEKGYTKFKSMMIGQFSGLVEIPAALLGYIFATLISSVLPFCLSFAAGAMMFVVVEEILPEASSDHHIDLGTMSFMVGFLIMMLLDILFA